MDFGCFSTHPLVFFEELELMGNFLGEDLVGVVLFSLSHQLIFLEKTL